MVRLSDEQIVTKANELLAKGNYSRVGLAKRIGTSKERLDKLAEQIPKYPSPMNNSQAATYGRIKSNDAWGGKFKLRGSPNYETKSNTSI